MEKYDHGENKNDVKGQPKIFINFARTHFTVLTALPELLPGTTKIYLGKVSMHDACIAEAGLFHKAEISDVVVVVQSKEDLQGKLHWWWCPDFWPQFLNIPEN